MARVGVNGVLDQLRDRLARIGLRAGQPADEIEGVGRTEHQGARGRLRHGPSVAPNGEGSLGGGSMSDPSLPCMSMQSEQTRQQGALDGQIPVWVYIACLS